MQGGRDMGVDVHRYGDRAVAQHLLHHLRVLAAGEVETRCRVPQVVEAYVAGMQDVRHPDWGSPAGTLLRRCLTALRRRPYWPYTQIRPEDALAMPPQVAEVYLVHTDALPLHDCEDYGYGVPHDYFKQCPLCGGRVGWYAYWHRHKDDPRTD